MSLKPMFSGMDMSFLLEMWVAFTHFNALLVVRYFSSRARELQIYDIWNLCNFSSNCVLLVVLLWRTIRSRPVCQDCSAGRDALDSANWPFCRRRMEFWVCHYNFCYDFFFLVSWRICCRSLGEVVCQRDLK